MVSLQSKGLSRVFSITTVQKHQFFGAQLSLWSIHDYWKTIALIVWTFVGKVMSLLFNMLSRFVTVFLPRSKRLLISWLQSPSTVILEPTKIKSVTVSIVSPSICHEVMEPDALIFIFNFCHFNYSVSWCVSLLVGLVWDSLCFLSEKDGLKLNIQKTKIMASGSITSWQIDGEAVETVADFIFLGCKITVDGDCSHEIKKRLLLGKKVMTT